MHCLTSSVDENNILFERSNDCSQITRLECRLEEWMQTVDVRLNALLAACSCPAPSNCQNEFYSEDAFFKPSSWYEEDVENEAVSEQEYEEEEREEPETPSKTLAAKKQASRRLMSQAFFRKCDSVARQDTIHIDSQSCIERIVLHKYFDYGISLVLTLNAVLIGTEVEWRAHGQPESLPMQVLEWACALVFAVELLLRLCFTPTVFLRVGQRAWALLDMVLVGMSLVDLVRVFLPGTMETARGLANIGSTGRLLKIARMLRILRLLRMVRFLSELRVMTNMIQKSLKSLFWLFSLLALLIYIFSVTLTQGAIDYLGSSDYHESAWVVEARYGGLFTTMYTLFQAMCGGVSWGEVTTPLQSVGPVYFVISLVYIFFSIFSVLNIVTGVFVDGAIELAKQDRSMLTAKKALSREASAIALVELLKEMDEDGNNILTLAELKNSLMRTDVQEYLDALSVDTTEAEMIFTLLDEDGNGKVDIVEFVAGMQRLQGEARNFDIQVLMYTNRQVLAKALNIFDRMNYHPSKLSDRGTSRAKASLYSSC